MFWFLLIVSVIVGINLFLKEEQKRHLLEKQKRDSLEYDAKIDLAEKLFPKFQNLRLDILADINELKKHKNRADREEYKYLVSKQEELEKQEELISNIVKNLEKMSSYKRSSDLSSPEIAYNKMSTDYYRMKNETGYYLEQLEDLIK